MHVRLACPPSSPGFKRNSDLFAWKLLEAAPIRGDRRNQFSDSLPDQAGIGDAINPGPAALHAAQ
jgi:hypothetical protein